MAKHTPLPVAVTDKEKWLGFFYLAFELCLLPSILLGIHSLLRNPIPDAWLNFLYFVLNFILVASIFKGFYRRCLSHTCKHGKEFLLAVIPGFCVYWLVNFLLSMAISQVVPEFSNLNDNSIANMTTQHFTIMVIGTVILVPVVEETLHRGLVFGVLYRRSRVLAYGFSTVLFALIHVAGYLGVYSTPALIAAFVQYLPAGLILAWTYRKSGSIFAPILMHIAINAVGIYIVR